MTDLVWPVDIIPSEVEWRLIDNVSVSQSPFSGATRRVSRPGTRWGARLTFNNLSGANRHRVMALVAALRGRANSIYVPDVSTVQRGSMSAPELLLNSDFALGTASWSFDSSNGTLAAIDGGLRHTLTKDTTSNTPNVFQQNNTTQYFPHATRSFVQTNAPAAVTGGPAMSDGIVNSSNYSLTRGLLTSSIFVPTQGTSNVQYAYIFNANGIGNFVARQYIDLMYASAARCFAVDNTPQLLTYSNTFTNAAWAKDNVTALDNQHTAPDGIGSAGSMIENSSTTGHTLGRLFTVSSGVADYFWGIVVGPSNRTWCFIQLAEATGGTTAYTYVNLSTGALGSSAVGANWADLRAGTVSLGNGYYYCWIIARKTNAATSLTAYLGAATANGTSVYAGSGTEALIPWRAVVAQSSVPVDFRATPTTGSDSSQTLQTAASKLYIKGGPRSATPSAITQGAYKAGDIVEIYTSTNGSQMVRLTAPLDIDAAGLGMLQFEPSLRASPSDNAQVILQKPMCRMMLSGSEQAWPTRPGLFSDFVLDLVEDVT